MPGADSGTCRAATDRRAGAGDRRSVGPAWPRVRTRCVRRLGRPPRGARLEFKGPSGDIAAQTTSQSDGYYRVALSPGSYTYKVQCTGFRDEDVGRGVALKISEGFAIYNFSLVRGKDDSTGQPPPQSPEPTGILTGRVLEKTDDQATRGVPQAAITLSRELDQQQHQVTTARDGRYRIVLPSGDWRASVSAQGYAKYADPDPIAVNSGERAERDFMLAAASSAVVGEQGIRGSITLQGAPASAITDPSLEVWIRPLDPVALPIRIESLDLGRYQRTLSPGTYQVAARHPSFRTAMSSPREVVSGSYTTIDLTLTPLPAPSADAPSALVVSVYEQLHDDVTDRAPLPESWVVVRRPNQPLEEAVRRQADFDGQATFTGLSPGDYDVLAYQEGFRPGGVQYQIVGGEEHHLEILLQRKAAPDQPTDTPPKTAPLSRGRLHVWVVQRTPTGVVVGDAANVRVLREGREAAAGATDGRGAFVTEPLEAGELQLDVGKEGFLPASLNVILEDRDQLLDVVLDSATPVTPATPGETPAPSPSGRPQPADPDEATGTVLTIEVAALRNDREALLSGADLYVLRDEQTLAHARTADDGRFAFRVPAGVYRVIAEHPGFHPAEVNVNVSDQDVRKRIVLRRADMPLQPDRKLTLVAFQAVADNGAGQRGALPGVDIYVLRGEQTIAHGRSNDQGLFRAELAPGAYRVVGEREGYHASKFGLQVAASDLKQQVVLRSLRLPPLEPTDPDRPGEVAPPPAARPPGDRPGEGPQPRPDPDRPGAMLTVLTTTQLDGRTQPLAGVEVCVLRGRDIWMCEITDAEGKFQAPVGPGPCVVAAEREGYQRATLEIQMGTEDILRRMVLRPISTGVPHPGGGPGAAPGLPPRQPSPGPAAAGKWNLHVQVVQRDQRGTRPVPGPHLRILRGGAVYAQGQADQAGRFHFRLPSGDYHLQIRRDGYREHTEPFLLRGRNLERQVVLIPIQPSPSPPGAPQSAAAHVQVVERGPEGGFSPLLAAQVQVKFAGKPVRQGATDRAGRFTAQLERGLYEVAASKPGYLPNRQQLDLQHGDAVARVILLRQVRPEPFTPPGGGPVPPPQPAPPRQTPWRLSVVERGPDGGVFPVRDATVEVYRGQAAVFRGRTDPDGQLSASLPQGELRLVIRKAGYRTHQDTIRAPNQPFTTRIQMQRGG